jgi:hypothetical protein
MSIHIHVEAINSEHQYFILHLAVIYNLRKEALTKISLSQSIIVPKSNIWRSAVRAASVCHPTKGFGTEFALIGSTLILRPEEDQSQAHNNYNV